MKFLYTHDKDDEIVRFEKIMLEKYSKILGSYRTMLAQNNYSLKVGCGWTNFIKKEYSAHRLSFKNGYECYIYSKYRKMVKKCI